MRHGLSDITSGSTLVHIPYPYTCTTAVDPGKLDLLAYFIDGCCNLDALRLTVATRFLSDTSSLLFLPDPALSAVTVTSVSVLLTPTESV